MSVRTHPHSIARRAAGIAAAVALAAVALLSTHRSPAPQNQAAASWNKAPKSPNAASWN